MVIGGWNSKPGQQKIAMQTEQIRAKNRQDLNSTMGMGGEWMLNAG